MRNFKYLFFTLLLVLNLKAEINNNEYHFGILIANYDKANQNRVKHLILKLSKEIQELFKEKINIVFIYDDTNLLENYKKLKKMNVLVVHSDFYLKNKTELKKISQRPFLFNNEGEIKNQYYLIANRDSNINELSDLKNKTYGSYVADSSYNMWADYILRKELNISLDKLVKNKNFVQKGQKLILDIYFNKSDFSVISKVVYDDMVALNPAIEKKVFILKKSKPIFFLAIGLFNKKTPEKLVKQYHKLVENGEFNRKFKSLYKLLNLYGIQPTTFDNLKELDTYYDEYKKLKKSM